MTVKIESQEHYQAELLKAHMIAGALRTMPLTEMVEMMERADAFGPLFHPSEWMKNSGKMREDLEIVKALAGALAKIRESRKKAGLEP